MCCIFLYTSIGAWIYKNMHALIHPPTYLAGFDLKYMFSEV